MTRLISCPVALIFGILSVVLPDSVKAETCRDGARATDELARNYRSAVRDLANACTNKTDAECMSAAAALDNALAALTAENSSLKQDCVAVSPPPPPPGSAPKPGNLVINEAMVNPNAVLDISGEWFEAFNATSVTLNLNGITISTKGGGCTIDTDLIVQAGAYVVIGRNDNQSTNGGVPVDYVCPALTLDDVGDFIAIRYQGTLIDSVSFTGFNVIPGRSVSLDPSAQTAVSNDNIINWCSASTQTQLPGGDFGTPGRANTACTTANFCTSDASCGSSQYCNVSAGQCVAKVPSGGVCTAGNQCLSGICNANFTCQ